MSSATHERGAVSGMTGQQRALLDAWLSPWRMLDDHSWPLQDTTTLRVVSERDDAAGEYIVKVSATSHHIRRDIAAHRDVVDALDVPAPRMRFADEEAGILVTDYLPGGLLLGTPWQQRADSFAQAGEILARLQVPGDVSEDYTRQAATHVGRLIERAASLVDAGRLKRLSDRLHAFRHRAVRLSFTHGDYQPRNWLVDDAGRVAVIDFGRGAFRSWVSDLVRLRSKDFVDRPDLADAFMSGLGRDLSDDDRELLRLEELREALGTIVWSHDIGDRDFEAHGHIMVERFLQE